MRVTQSMLSNNMLRNLNTNYGKMSKLQEQINSGSKISRPSDDPVVAVKGMGYRIDIDKIEQYQRNIGEAHTWLDSSDTALGLVGDSLHRVKELVVQAANDTNTADDRKKIAEEIKQIQEEFRDIANTKVGDNYIFSGTHTNMPLYTDGVAGQNPALSDAGKTKAFKLNVFDGVSIQVNSNASGLFAKVNHFMGELSSLLSSGATGSEIGNALGAEMLDSGSTTIPALDAVTNEALVLRSEVGARQNRIELMQNRLDLQFVNVTKQLSNNEDTDYSKAITEMTTAESIHQASLSVGSKIIQQTLVDFIR